MSAHSAGAYTATLLVMVNVINGVGVHPPPSPARANFTFMTECAPESSHCNSVYSVVATLKVHKIENFLGSDFEFCVISLLVMLKY